MADVGTTRPLAGAARLARATPDTRDRYIDLLRVASLAAVILGHWLMAIVEVGPNGTVRTTNLLAGRPTLQLATWLLQVMPVFFLVGGFSHATALDSSRRRGGGYTDFLRSRVSRLLRPTAVFVLCWLLIAVLIEIAGQDTGLLRIAARTVAQPLWFVGVYLLIIALAPPMLRLHRRLGRYAAAVPIALGAGTAAIDLAYFAGHAPHLRYLNVLLVWLAVHQLGFLYADGSLHRGWRRLRGVQLAGLLAGAGLAGLLVLTVYGPYPISMVGVPGERMSNMSPPTLALFTHAIWLTGIVLLLREPVSRWLRRRSVWTVIIVANGMTMTAFLWHLTALFVAEAGVLASDLTMPPTGSPLWWLLRPAWLTVLCALTAILVAAFRRADRPAPARLAIGMGGPAGHGPATVVSAGLGTALCAIGVLGLSAVGFAGPLSGRTATLVMLPVTPLTSATMVGVGAALLWIRRPSTRGGPR